MLEILVLQLDVKTDRYYLCGALCMSVFQVCKMIIIVCDLSLILSIICVRWAQGEAGLAEAHFQEALETS